MIKVPKDAIALKSLELVWAERLRQKEVEGYTPAHDDEHEGSQMAVLAAAYALGSRAFALDGITDRARRRPEMVEVLGLLDTYGWSFKPKDPIRDLVRAGALILAELERRLRMDGMVEGSGPCSICQSETTYASEYTGAWLCPDHGGKP